jgi:acyl-[acyl-carrier-protein]-phospholipid O-acyltransferase/long-chain-fatty-acid--[acyl-carrier-protein] ligase
MRALIRVILGVLFRTKLVGGGRLNFTGPAIVLPNHVSFLDAIFLYAYLPAATCFVVNTAIAARISPVLRFVSHVTVDPLNPYSLKKIVSAVKEGRPVVLFPEGRITTTGGLMKVYGGVGFIALKTAATLYPVIFLGPERSKLSRITDKVKSFWFPRVTIYIAPPAQVAVSAGRSFRQQKKEVGDRLLAMLQNALFRARQHRDAYTNIFNRFLDAVALNGGGKRMAADIGGAITYRKAAIGSYVLGGKLRQLLSGEPVAGVLLPNSIGHVVTLLALFAVGKTPAVMNFSAGAENNIDCGLTAGARTIITSRLFVEKAGFAEYVGRLAEKFRIVYLEDVRAAVTVADRLRGLLKYCAGVRAVNGAPRVILFTSGSESKPKGVVLRHANILANINQAAAVIDYTPSDRMLNALPMFHSFGLTVGTLLPILEGIEVFLYPTPLHYKIIPELAYDRNVTLLLGTPTFLAGYARYAHPYDFYRMRYVLAGGEKLPDEVRRTWQEKFGLRILEGYGTTETAPVLSINTPLFYRAGTVGRFLPGVEWRLEAVPGIAAGGNLLVRGPNVMEGYLLSGRGFVPAGEWYDCGDVVSVDADGFVKIDSRLKRFAKVSGEMVSLDAVEQTARQCFGTDKVAAVNLPDARRGEKIVLYAIAKGASRQALREFMNTTRQNMLALPAAVVAVDKLPLLGSGKVDYVTLKADALREEAGDG